MNDLPAVSDRSDDELSDQAPGTSVILIGQGWEEADYVEPGDDWHALADGSYVSPDGTIRSWPLFGPTEY